MIMKRNTKKRMSVKIGRDIAKVHLRLEQEKSLE